MSEATDFEEIMELQAIAADLLAALKGALEFVDDLKLTYPNAHRDYIAYPKVDDSWRAIISKAEAIL